MANGDNMSVLFILLAIVMVIIILYMSKKDEKTFKKLCGKNATLAHRPGVAKEGFHNLGGLGYLGIFSETGEFPEYEDSCDYRSSSCPLRYNSLRCSPPYKLCTTPGRAPYCSPIGTCSPAIRTWPYLAEIEC
jgi:hypothetical protein